LPEADLRWQAILFLFQEKSGIDNGFKNMDEL
jgi:hypothetical protein